MVDVEDLEIPEATVYLAHLKTVSPMEELTTSTPWKKRTSVIYGRKVSQPRLTAWYGDEGCHYSYSGVSNTPLPWTETLRGLKRTVEEMLQYEFNSALLNYYRDGKDAIGFHSDDERELGATPVIASLSFGVKRYLMFRQRRGEYADYSVALDDCSLLVMMGDTQKNWKHGISRSTETKPRINVTFRKILG